MAPLVHLSPSNRGIDPKVLKASGGFAWWYVDLLDEHGDGLVCIWSFGLPFLPGYLSAARQGNAPQAQARPSFNLAVYRNFDCVFYSLQEFGAEHASWTKPTAQCDVWRFGNSVVEREIGDAQWQINIKIELSSEGSALPLRGCLNAAGPKRGVCTKESVPDNLATHDWTPISARNFGECHLQQGRTSVLNCSRGRVYHDRNASSRPFDALGIRHWLWSRVSFADYDLVFYWLWPTDRKRAAQCLSLRLDAERTQSIDDLSIDLGQPRLSTYGVPWWPCIRLSKQGRPWMLLEVDSPVDRSPFYLRHFVRAQRFDTQEQALGSMELCRPRRVDRSLEKPFVRMRVQQPSNNSFWLPFFSGYHAQRWQRLLRLPQS